MTYERSSGAVVFKKNHEVKYLILRHSLGHFDFVKGNIEPNESEKETVIRELEEEASITQAQFFGGFREKISYFYKREGKTIYKEVVFYLIEAQNSNVKLSYEHVGYEWLKYQEAIERLTFKTTKNVLRKAHECLKTRRIADFY